MKSLKTLALLLVISLVACAIPAGSTANPLATSAITPTLIVPSTTTPTLTFTETATLMQIPLIDAMPASFPPRPGVQESYGQGEYVEGIQKAKAWVGIWTEKGILTPQSIGGAGNSLNPVPLDGNARVVCLDTKGQGEFGGRLLCPPLDLVLGGLRSIPSSESWDVSTDAPLFITLQGTEEVITKGTASDLAYQVINKYTKAPQRYVDPKTGQYVDGEYQVPGGEIKLPNIVPESINQIPDLSFNMEFKDPKAAYRMLLQTVVGSNLRNWNFWLELLGTSAPTVDQLLAFARINVGGPENKAYWLPFTTRSGYSFNFLSVIGNISDLRMVKPKISGVYLDGMYGMFFCGDVFLDSAKMDFIKGIKSDNKQISMRLIGSPSDGIWYEEFGLLFINNRFAYVSGDEGIINHGPYAQYLLGGVGNKFRPDHDPAIVSAQFLTYLKAMANCTRDNSGIGQICTWSSDTCPHSVYSGSLSPENWVVKERSSGMAQLVDKGWCW